MIDSKKQIEIFNEMAKRIHENKAFLTDLDIAIGDGDHGINMSRGFLEVQSKLPSVADKDIGTIYKTVGMVLVSTVGGASGPLFGTAFMMAGAAIAGKTEINAEDFIAILDAAIYGISKRGKSKQGEKTMLDSFIPARDAFNDVYQQTGDYKAALKQAVLAANEGVEYTKTIIATKGRASYLGQRSIGHQDPGATTIALMIKAIYDVVRK